MCNRGSNLDNLTLQETGNCVYGFVGVVCACVCVCVLPGTRQLGMAGATGDKSGIANWKTADFCISQVTISLQKMNVSLCEISSSGIGKFMSVCMCVSSTFL